MKRGTPDHPKVAMLASRLDVPLYSAVGILEMLWHFTAEFCPRGNVGKFPDKSICAAIKWGKSRINLIQVLLECGFLEEHSEHRLIVHDWQDHADQAVRRKLERANESMVTSQRLVAVKPLTSISPPLPLPLPLPIYSAATAEESAVESLPFALTTSNGNGKRAKVVDQAFEGWFDHTFWPKYPRKVGKAKAKLAAVKKMTTDERRAQAMARLEFELPEMLAREPKWRLHASTWFNSDEWADPIEADPALSDAEPEYPREMM